MAKLGCASMLLGLGAFVLAIVARLSTFAPMGVGAHSFAASGAILLLLSISAHACAAVCFGQCGPSKNLAEGL